MRLIEKLPQSHWREKKLADIQKVILNCAGVFAEATTKDFLLTPNAKTEVLIEILNRSDVKVTLSNVRLTQRVGEDFMLKTVRDTATNFDLKNNAKKI